MADKTQEKTPTEPQMSADAAAPANLDEIVSDGLEAVAETPESMADGTALDAAVLLDTVARLEAELIEARQECADITEKSQRLAAEFQNSRRRQERQLAEEMERVSAHIIKRLLPVIDDFDLALANMPALDEAQQAWAEGFRQIQRKLRGVLEEEGLTPILTEGAFDPTLHEAIASAPSDDVESGHITETLRSGYTLKGRVLRPALVRVAL